MKKALNIIQKYKFKTADVPVITSPTRMKLSFKLQGSPLGRPESSGFFKSDEVTTLANLFDGCTKLTSVDLTGWKIDGIADLSNMFKGCSELTTITLDGWKLTSDTVITDMLTGCTKLATVNIKGCDDNTWNLIGQAVDKLSQTVNVNRK